MKTIFQVTDLISSLPHRPPMIWVNEVLVVGDNYKDLTGTCLVELDKSSLYVSNGRELRASSAIEFTAQGFGYLKAAYQKLHKMNKPPSKTYLTGVRSCRADFSSLSVDKINQLHINIRVLRDMRPITYVRGEICVPGSDTVYGEAEIQVYFDE